MKYIPDNYRYEIKLTKLKKKFKVYNCLFNYFRSVHRGAACVIFYSFLYDSAVKTKKPYIYTTHGEIKRVWEEEHHRVISRYLNNLANSNALTWQFINYDIPIVNDPRKSKQAGICKIELNLIPSEIECPKLVRDMNFEAAAPISIRNMFTSYINSAKAKKIKEIKLQDIANDLVLDWPGSGSIKTIRRIINELNIPTNGSYFGTAIYP